jgi:AAHS family 4-hydroxybenzoate transporter-like MFS transporter
MSEPGSTNISALIDEHALSALQVLTFVLGALVILFDGANTISISVAAPQMAAALGLPVSSFGPVFSAGQAGLLAGSLALGPLADRWGRKGLVTASTALFGIFALLTVLASSFEQLLVYRLLTGLGLGGAAPNVVALASEYAPRRIRSAVVTVLWAAFPLGGVLMGLLGGYPWRVIFYVSGAIPLVLAVLLVVLLPESPAFLAARGGASPERIARIVSRIAPDRNRAALGRFWVDEQKLTGVPVKHLFSPAQAMPTVLLWVMFFCDFLILVSVNAWTPSLLSARGLPVARAGFAIAWNSIGSTVGAIIVGRLLDRWGSFAVLNTVFLAAAACVGALAFATAPFAWIATLSALAGFFAGAGQAGVIAVAARTYPVAARSTGVGWAMAVGRLGAVVGPLVGGILLGWNLPVSSVFLSFAIPGVFAAMAATALNHTRRVNLKSAPAEAGS